MTESLSEFVVPEMAPFMGRIVRHTDGRTGTCYGYSTQQLLVAWFEGVSGYALTEDMAVVDGLEDEV